MAGNVTEWTASDYALYPGSEAKLEPNTENFKVMRGGNFWSPNETAITTCRVSWSRPDFKDEEINDPKRPEIRFRVGFRVAADSIEEDRKANKRVSNFDNIP